MYKARMYNVEEAQSEQLHCIGISKAVRSDRLLQSRT